MSGVPWVLVAFNPPSQKLAWKVDCPLSKWKVNTGQSILYNKLKLGKKKPDLSHPLATKIGVGWVDPTP
jgi:hypothetical protein